MKLLTHNMMTSHVKGVKNGYPLKLMVREKKEVEVDFNAEFIARMLPRIDYGALRATAVQVGTGEGLPDVMPEAPETNEEFLKMMHHVLLEVHITNGALQCPESGTEFPIENGIPNMLLPEPGQ